MKADALTRLRSQKLISKPVLPAPASLLLADGRAKRTEASLRRTTSTMSLYPADVARMKEIRRVLEDSGIKRVSDSEAVRVALRQVSVDASVLVVAYRAMLTDDQRRRQTVSRA